LETTDQQVHRLGSHPRHVLRDRGQARLEQVSPFEVEAESEVPSIIAERADGADARPTATRYPRRTSSRYP
jgi:hypothetical protein